MLDSLLWFSRRADSDQVVTVRREMCSKILSLKRLTWPEAPLNGGRFIVFDTETTGLDWRKDEIIALAGVVIDCGVITGETYSTYVNPGRGIPALATEITGITDAMVAEAPDIMTALHQFLLFADSATLVAHHGQFDLGFINAVLRKHCGQKLEFHGPDTYLISQFLSPHRRHHSLERLGEIYGISLTGRHTALGDALITARLFLAMVEDLIARGIDTVGDLSNCLQFRRLI